MVENNCMEIAIKPHQVHKKYGIKLKTTRKFLNKKNLISFGNLNNVPPTYENYQNQTRAKKMKKHKSLKWLG